MAVKPSTNFLDLPNEVLDKIVDYLPLAARKNLRSCCWQLNDFCYSERYCRNEVIVWPKEPCECVILSTFKNSTRTWFDLVFIDEDFDFQQSTSFFEQYGAKVRSLVFKNCKFPRRWLSLESIIVYCPNLCSLSMGRFHECTFSFESNTVTRPSLTFFEMVLDYETLRKPQLQSIFRRIQTVFPCVKHLGIEYRGPDDEIKRCKRAILDFVVKFSHLKSLKLFIRVPDTFLEKPNFLKLLPRLEQLHLSLELKELKCPNFWKELASQLSIVEPPLRHLSLVTSYVLSFPMDVFNALVSSKLKTINFQAIDIKIKGSMAFSSFEVNETVTDLTLHCVCFVRCSTRVMSTFISHFHALVHLEIGTVSDADIQKIFKYQKNLRSLVLENCKLCSEAGFCGTINGERSKNSIANLQNLEYLSLKKIDVEVVESKVFQSTFNFPRLKYLRITLGFGEAFRLKRRALKKVDIPIDMLKACANLEALHFGPCIAPSQILSSVSWLVGLYLKKLNYLHINFQLGLRTYVNLSYFYTVDEANLLLDSVFEKYLYHYDEILNRTVFTAEIGKKVSLLSPKISSHTIDWICLI